MYKEGKSGDLILQEHVVLDQQLEENYITFKLGVKADALSLDGIQFQPWMNKSDIDRVLRSKLQQLFQYLDTKHPIQDGEVHWHIMMKKNKTLQVFNTNNLSGVDLMDLRGVQRNWWQYCLYFGEFLLFLQKLKRLLLFWPNSIDSNYSCWNIPNVGQV